MATNTTSAERLLTKFGAFCAREQLERNAVPRGAWHALSRCLDAARAIVTLDRSYVTTTVSALELELLAARQHCHLRGRA